MNDENYENYFIQPSEIPLSHPNAHIDMVKLIMALITTMCRKLTKTEFNNWSYVIAATLDRDVTPMTRLSWSFINERGPSLWSELAAWRLSVGHKTTFDRDRATQMALNILQLVPPGFQLNIHEALLPDFRIPLTQTRRNLWRIFVDHEWQCPSEVMGTPYRLKEPYPMNERVRKHTGRHATLTGKNGSAVQTDLHVWSSVADTDETPFVPVSTLVKAIQGLCAEEVHSHVSVLSIREDMQTEKFTIDTTDPWYPVTERLLKIEITDKAIDEICNKIRHIAEKECLISPHLTSKGMTFYDSPVVEVNIESFWSIDG